MTCRHVLDVIDAGPLAVLPEAQLAAPRAHALDCPTCGPALATMQRVEAGLSALGDEMPAPDFTAAVLARIAELPAVTVPAVEPVRAVPRWQPWLAAAGALGALAAVAATQWTASALAAALAPRTGTFTASLVALPAAEPAVLVVAAGLLLYANGLFSLAATASPARRDAGAGTDPTPP